MITLCCMQMLLFYYFEADFLFVNKFNKFPKVLIELSLTRISSQLHCMSGQLSHFLMPIRHVSRVIPIEMFPHQKYLYPQSAFFWLEKLIYFSMCQLLHLLQWGSHHKFVVKSQLNWALHM